MDLSGIGDEEMETLKSYEGQNLTFTIANKEMDPVYTTGSSQDNLYQEERQVHRNIVVYRKFFEKIQKYSSGMQEEKKRYGYLEG